MIASALFYLIIYPIQMLIDLCYFVTLHLLGNENPVYGLLGVSAMISLCTLPIYLRAEKWQEKERAIQKAMSARVAKIKAAFSGDERQMMLQTYYKQNAYHPVYALRNSLGVLFQVPFFIAAYYYISHLSALQGVSFLAIKDLSRPDALLAFGAFNINVLPIVMTLINIVSGAVYAKDLPFKDKAQLYVMSALFLVLLYDSPAGLVIYWTANNVFSLIKNIIEKSKSPKKIVAIGFFCIIGAAIIYVLGFHQGYFPKRVVTAMVLLALAAAPFVALKIKKIAVKKEIFLSFRLYLISCLTLFFLTGLVIPSSIIASSVEEFSFIEAATRPFPFIGMCALQAAGIFLAWTMILYFLFSNRVKQSLTFAMLLVAIMGIVNVFLVKVDYGFLQNMLYFSDEKSLRMEKITSIATSSFLFVFVPVLFIIAYSKKTKKFFIGFGSVMAAALLCLGIVNIARIEQDFRIVNKNKERYDAAYEKVFNFSKDQKNVLFILLDMMVGSYIPHIFDEKPELASEFDGFTWFPNTVSYANHTWIGSVPCYGGYEYTPFEINKRQDAGMMQKRKEAYLLLPTLFADSGYKVTVTDPLGNDFLLSNLSIYKDDPRLNALNIKGRYTKRWLENHKEIHAVNITEILTDRLLRFSFFKMAPLFLRAYVYNGGHYLSVQYEFGKPASDYTAALIDSYALIDQAPELTTFEESSPTFSSIYLALAHEPAYMQAPDYIPSDTVVLADESPMHIQKQYHSAMASFILLGKWFDFLKENNCYDNTRIIIVSDHGRSRTDYPGNIFLPNDNRLQDYNPLLMVKDFDAKNAEGAIAIDNTFMTNADAPLLTLEGIIENPVNPWTQKPIVADKAGDVLVTTISLSNIQHLKSKWGYVIKENEWLAVHDNIFDPQNWTAPLIKKNW